MAFQPGDKAMLEGYIQVARPLEDMFSVKGKVALVPGGSSGLGFDIAYRLLQGGAKVVIASNSTVEEEAALGIPSSSASAMCGRRNRWKSWWTSL